MTSQSSNHVQLDRAFSNGLVISIKLYTTSTPHLQVCHHQSCTLLPSCQLPLVSALAHPSASTSQCIPSRWTSGNATQWCGTCRYPNNFVLRLLTPQDTCRPLDIYPIKLTQDAIYVDVGAAASSRAYQTTRGGADSSIERNNVYALQPKSYVQGQDPSGDCSCVGVSLYIQCSW